MTATVIPQPQKATEHTTPPPSKAKESHTRPVQGVQPPDRPKWLDLIKPGQKRQCIKWSQRTFKRTGIEVPWVLMPILQRVYLQTEQMKEKRGLSRDELTEGIGIPSISIDLMVQGGVLQIQKGFEYPEIDGKAAWFGTPIELFRLSERLEKFLGQHNA